MILALDPGERFGYAWSSDRRVHAQQSGVWHFEHVSEPGRRFGLLLGELELAKPEILVYELAGGLRGKAARTWHGGYLAIVQTYAVRGRAQLLVVHPKTLKLFATGNGSAPKPAMRHAAATEFDADWLRNPKDAPHDQIDALWVLAWGLAELEDQAA